MKKMPLQCGRMANVATEYCTFIDDLDDMGREGPWVVSMEKLLPRLHVAVTALVTPGDASCRAYQFYDDDQRCELYMRLHHVLQSDVSLWSAYNGFNPLPQIRQKLSARIADDLTDMYFDLKYGLELLEDDPGRAVNNWLCSFYVHWGQHLLDAECCLYAVEAGSVPPQLPKQNWPQSAYFAASPV